MLTSLNPSLRTPPCTITPSRPAAPPVIRSVLAVDSFNPPPRDEGLELLGQNLEHAWNSLDPSLHFSPADVRRGTSELTRALFEAPESFRDTEALMKSGALHDAVKKLEPGQKLPVVQRFSSMEEAKKTLGLQPKKWKQPNPKPKGFFGKLWNTIVREPTKKQPFWKKALAVVGSSLAFSLFDYVGFNLARKHDKVGLYRPLQIAAQAGLTFFLKENFGWKTAGAFNALWWTFNDDLLYYSWAELLNPGNGWDSKGSLKSVLTGDPKVTWGWWTPAGLVNMLGEGKMSDPLSGKTLLVQAGVGAVVALTLLALD